MSHLLNGPLTPSETYSDIDDENYNSPKNSSETNTAHSVQKNMYEEYPTPTTVNEGSNDVDDASSNYGNNNNYQYLNSNFSLDNLIGHKPYQESDNNYFNDYAYQLQQFQGQNSYENYQQGLNTELVQPYSVANFDFSSRENYQQKGYPDEKQENVNIDDLKRKSSSSAEIQSDKTEEIPHKNEKKDQKPYLSHSTENFLMQPPDSESIAAAAVTARKNRSKRRTRVKYEKEQLDLLEASFQRTHYPDVNVVDRLAEILKLSTDKISVWFQNRRAKFKRSKKPVGGNKEPDFFPDPEANPLAFLEAAQKEIEMRKESESFNTSDTNESVCSKADHQIEIKKSLPRNSKTPELENETEKPEIQDYHDNRDNQAYESAIHPMYQSMAKAPILPFSNQNFFQPQLIEANQYYQPGSVESNNSYSSHSSQNKLPVSQNKNDQNRTSMSPVNTSSDARSGSPNSESSENPDTSESRNSPVQHAYDQNTNYSGAQTENYDNTGYLQSNMLMGTHYPCQIMYPENTYRQNYIAPPILPLPPGNPSQPNIFQPYADCNTSSLNQNNYPYLPNISGLRNPMPYYQHYYNE